MIGSLTPEIVLVNFEFLCCMAYSISALCLSALVFCCALCFIVESSVKVAKSVHGNRTALTTKTNTTRYIAVIEMFELISMAMAGTAPMYGRSRRADRTVARTGTTVYEDASLKT